MEWNGHHHCQYDSLSNGTLKPSIITSSLQCMSMALVILERRVVLGSVGWGGGWGDGAMGLTAQGKWLGVESEGPGVKDEWEGVQVYCTTVQYSKMDKMKYFINIS